MNAVEIEDLRVVKDKQAILKGITVSLPEGRIIGFLGPSGAGKTTLMRSIIGRQKISKGKISIFGKPAGHKELRRDIGYMTQGTAVYPDLTLSENLEYFAAMCGAHKSRAREVLKEVDLYPQAGQLVRTLSGGQQSRASLAVALLAKPRLLVLDEPTVGVDPVLRAGLWELFHGLAAEGSTLLVSSHVMDEADRCDELLLIRDGGLLAYGTPHELRERTGSPNVEESFLKLVGDKK